MTPTLILMVFCPSCGAEWDMDMDPAACTCDYSDPDVVVLPWSLTLMTERD